MDEPVAGLLAMLLFIPGFVLVAAGVCWVVFSLAGSALAKPPHSLDVALHGTLPGIVMLLVGVALLFASRTADGGRGPVRDYGRARE